MRSGALCHDPPESAGHLHCHVQGKLLHPAEVLGTAPEYSYPSVHSPGCNPGLQDAVLEPGCRRAGAHGCPCECHIHVLYPGWLAQLAAYPGHAGHLCDCRTYLGWNPGLLQGQVRHQRDPLYPYDELCGNPAGQVLHRSMGAQRLQCNGSA